MTWPAALAGRGRGDIDELRAALERAGLTDVDDSALARSLYASDASLYRIEPRVVARPRHVDEVAAVLEVARDAKVPVTMRGAGTSIAGNAVGAGIVVDTARHLNRVLALDAEAGTATVQPGTVHATLQAAAASYGLRFGPDPSTHTRCTIGGMIGNNACGSRALAYGRTSDNVVAVEAWTLDGQPATAMASRLAGLVDGHLAEIRQRFGSFSRQGSGYALEHLLPERDRSLERFLVGSEGTLAVVTGATVQLVRDPGQRVLVVLGYPSMADAADAVPSLLAHRPVACEGIDERITSLVADRPELPAGRGWLLVELAGDDEAELRARAGRVVAHAAARDSRLVSGSGEQAALWRIREDGAGLASRATRPPGQSGWEDAAVPPESLGAYLREFDALLEAHGLHGAPYGHFGDGCVHVRIDFALSTRRGREGYRKFVEAAARLTAEHGGSLSGEHGDGRARSELLPVMYDDVALRLFAEVKRIFDPDDLLNPGVLVDPAPLDADLRLAGVPSPMPSPMAGPMTGPMISAAGTDGADGGAPRTFLTLHHDGGDLTEAVHRCTGVGKCLADSTAAGGVMCPSYLATREEKDSTRGRARVLQDAVTGRLPGGWQAAALEDALDLCLACKGCARDCPTGVDMATYKAEYLHQKYAGRRRPRSHHTLGRLPQLLARVPPWAANLGMRVSPALAKALAGVDRRRGLPPLAASPLSRRPPVRVPDADVVLWVDTFTNRFTPQVAEAARAVLTAAGQRVDVVVEPDQCCGLTLLSTGQLERARSALSRVFDTLAACTTPERPAVVLEPSCLAVLRHDSRELLGDAAAPVAERVVTLAERLTALGWSPPDLSGIEVVAQPHCHQASVLGWQADAQLLESAGATVTRVGGCCGLAGNFGMEQGHYEVSRAVFEHDLGPAVRAAGADAVLLTDGFSCRTQLADLAGRESRHLAELLAAHLHSPSLPPGGTGPF